MNARNQRHLMALAVLVALVVAAYALARTEYIAAGLLALSAVFGSVTVATLNRQ